MYKCRLLCFLSVCGRAKEMRVQLGSLLHKPKAISEPESVAVKQQKLPWTSGVTTFRAFLCSEFSEENLEFWLACEDYRSTRTSAELANKAQRIYREFITVQAPKEVNLDSTTREKVTRNLEEPSAFCFQLAQERIRSLMENDSFPRFLKSEFFLELIKHHLRG
uniref:RGS domain-containing protein n=1 Tax=Callorhinchus milii TaxID=7868 RepID=A0A4W3GQ78_CALMI